ncbi:MAG TPA: zinc-binding dehydrogenase [Streptosporangiaceae bacterium]
MRAATIRDRKIVVAEHPDPRPGPGEVLVRVRAAGLNGADPMQVAGHYPPPPGSGAPADIPGLEMAGEVVETGPNAIRFNPGDRVMSVLAGAGQAELAVVHERQLMPVPLTLDWPQAGGFAEVFMTAYDAIFGQAGLRTGERLLVHGAAGGVGTAAVQLGATAGAQVVATVRNHANRDGVAALGAGQVIDPVGFGEHGPFDVILELVGAPNLADNLDSLALWGRIVVIGVGAGAATEVNLYKLMHRRGRISASTLRSRPLEEKATLARLVEAHVLPLAATGKIRVPVAATFPLADAAAAYERFTAGGKLGKIILTMP